MMYNDSPILNPEEYKILESHYQKPNLPSDRKLSLAKICLLLNQCKSACPFIIRNVNNKIGLAIEKAERQLSIVLENLNNTETNTQTFKELGVFSMLKNISTAMQELLNWQETEQKEYYKLIIKKSISSLCEISNNILSAIEKSNIKIFKFM